MVTTTVPADRQRYIGKFARVELLGKGAMGEVWRSWDTQLSRFVALKLLHRRDDVEMARFWREAQTAAGLSHPNLAALYEFGVHESQPFIAMQLVRGQTLKTFPRRDRRTLVRLVRDAARAVAYANESGVIHRDLKPENLMVETQGRTHRVYVMDFGLAHAVDNASITPGRVVGTPDYMPPEQARGDDVDARADVYALGATLYDLLSGRPPFRSKNILETMRRTQNEEPEPLRALDARIDADLETIVLTCLAKDPARRYASARELAEELTCWLDGLPIRARGSSASYRLKKFVVRRRAVLVPAAALLVAAAAVFAWPKPRSKPVVADSAAAGRSSRDRVKREA